MSRFNNPSDLVEQMRNLPLPPQQRPAQFIVDLEPKVINSFNFPNTIRPHNINYKQPFMVEPNTRMPKNNYGSSAFSPHQLPPMKAKNFI
tara:strand:- start:5609 stop:5878 length:270 start_codon:yes stop_codon:yes gene_type:complete